MMHSSLSSLSIIGDGGTAAVYRISTKTHTAIANNFISSDCTELCLYEIVVQWDEQSHTTNFLPFERENLQAT